MKAFFKTAFILAFTFLFSACNSKKSDGGKEVGNQIIVKDGWVRPANKGANSAVYLTIINNTSATDTLIDVNTNVAKTAGVHRTYRNEGMVGMKEAGHIVIQANSKFILEPGDYHIMLMNLNRTLAKGDSVQLVLDFAVSKDIETIVPVTR